MAIFISFLCGIFLLILGAKWFIESAETIAHYFRIPEIVIGMIIVGCGTSLPELFIATTATIQGEGVVALANVIGANIANIALIGGLLLMLLREIPQQHLSKRDLIYFTASNTIIFGLIVLSYVYGDFRFSWIGSIALLCMLGYYLYHEMGLQRNSQQNVKSNISKNTWLFFILGFFLLIIGSQMTVYYLQPLAKNRGMSEYVISIVVVALGTTLPEQVTSVIAYMKGAKDIAIGNIIGSNIFNMFGVLGISSLFGTITIEKSYRKDGLMMMVCSLLFVVILSQRKLPSRVVFLSGLGFILLYGGYIGWRI